MTTLRIPRVLFVAAVLVLSGAAVATASDAPKAAPPLTPAELMTLKATMPAGDAARGGDLHATYWCSSCHGTEGVSWSFNYPSVAGQAEVYLYKTLLDYRDGRRVEGDGRWESMAASVRALSDQDLADLSAYYAAEAPPTPATAPVAPPPEVMTLIRHGDPSRLMTACASCHGVGGTGGKPEAPRLAGLERAYLERTLRLFHGGERASDTDRNMRFFAERLSDAEIEALAAYYAGQP
jgi:cytochrome c553